jgi:PTH1 family peptidyl-tRNA hydrolase
MKKFLVVGLGNIGESYHHTRHNIGFNIVDTLSSYFNSSFEEEKYGCVSRFRIKGKPVIVLKPNTFMNLSGKAVQYHLHKNKLTTDNLLIVADDIHLPFGKIKIKRKGSDGGHNGHKDIINTLNTSNYSRLKFGVGNNFNKGGQAKYVLSKWNSEEKKMLENFLQSSINVIINFCNLGIDKAMSDYN